MSERTYSAEFASGFRAVLTLSPAFIQCEWSPGQPGVLRGQRRRRFLAAYRAWRNSCVDDFTKQTGITILVVDL